MKKIIAVAVMSLMLTGCASMAELEKRSDGLAAYPTIQYDKFHGTEIVKSYETTRVTKPYDKLKLKSCLYEVVRNDIMVHTDNTYGITSLEAGGHIIDKVKKNSAEFSGNFEQTVTTHTILGSTPFDQYVKYKGLMYNANGNTHFIFTGLSIKPKSGGEFPMWSRKTNSPEESIKELDVIATDIADCLNDE